MKDLGFHDRFLQLISRSVRGTFSGSNGPGILRDLVDTTDFDDKESTLAFAARVDACLHRELGKDDGEVYRVGVQVRKGTSVEDVYRQIFALEYLRPEYTLNLGDKSLSALSPGERGALLLIFYLLVDNSRAPVILDQPDENLDNETVFELLVPCIREAKQDRQLIVVTHNPNIAVVCDAEQVIHAAIEKGSDYRITYTTGAIENPEINKHLLDVLEGTRPAFRDRDEKYL
ncbi:MAG: AAA family ATPase [Gammaproteobacteria bacterium]